MILSIAGVLVLLFGLWVAFFIGGDYFWLGIIIAGAGIVLIDFKV